MWALLWDWFGSIVLAGSLYNRIWISGMAEYDEFF